MIVDEIPAPALLVGAQQRHIAVALQCRRARRNPNDGHRAQRSLPHHLPRVASVAKADFRSRRIGTLGNRTPAEGRAHNRLHRNIRYSPTTNSIPVQRESVGLDVNVWRTIVRVPRMMEGAQLALVRRHRRQQLGLERLVGEPADALHAPHLVVLVAQIAIPVGAHLRTAAQLVQVQIREDQLQHVVGQVAGTGRGHCVDAARIAADTPHGARCV